MHQNLQSQYLVFNILDLLEDENIGENIVNNILSKFSCINKEIEIFLKNKAIKFANESIAATFLVFEETEDTMLLLGYFTLANKHFEVDTTLLSRKLRDKINHKFQHMDTTNKYSIPAPLIAQLGKNYTDNLNKRILGDDLIGLALEKVCEAQKILPGKISFIECEEIDNLIEFYKRHGFVEFSRRSIDEDEKTMTSSSCYLQMLRYRNNKSLF